MFNQPGVMLQPPIQPMVQPSAPPMVPASNHTVQGAVSDPPLPPQPFQQPPLPPVQADPEVLEQESDSSDEDVDQETALTPEERVFRCCEVLGLEIPKEDKNNNLCSFDVPNKKPKMMFPPSAKFMDYMEEWEKNMAGQPGSFRATKFPNQVAKQGLYPNAFKVKTDFYEIPSNPWGTVSLPDPQIKKSAIYSYDNKPYIKLSTDELCKWELTSRKCLAILNYNEHFVVGARSILTEVMEKLRSSDWSDKDQEATWDTVGQAKDILESAGKSIHDLAKLSVDRLGAEVSVRRDAWIGSMTDHLSAEDKDGLRCTKFWGSSELFSKGKIQELMALAEAKKTSKVQNVLLEKAKPPAQSSNNTQKKLPFRGNDQKRKFVRSSFKKDGNRNAKEPRKDFGSGDKKPFHRGGGRGKPNRRD